MSVDNPEVTLIVPARDSSAYLGKCIESVLKQKYTDWELIIINDNSVDDTPSIAVSYAEGEPRIYAYDSPGSGVSSARNYGMRLARGRYIGFLDADDSVDPDYLSVLVGNAHEENADISQCSFCLLYRDGRRVENNESIQAVFDNHKDIMNAYFSGIIGSVNVACWGKIFKKETFKDILFDERLLIEEDAYFTFQCCMRASKIVCSNAPLYYYFQHPESVMNGTFDSSNMQYFTVFDRELVECREDGDLCLRIKIRKLTTALDLISKIVREGSGAEHLRELRQIALNTEDEIKLGNRLRFKIGLKCFLIRHMPFVFYGILRVKGSLGRNV